MLASAAVATPRGQLVYRFMEIIARRLAPDEFGEVLGTVEEGVRYARHVLIPMQPVDVEAMLDEAAEAQAQADRDGAADTTLDDLENVDDLDDAELQQLLDEARSGGGGTFNRNRGVSEDYDTRGR